MAQIARQQSRPRLRWDRVPVLPEVGRKPLGALGFAIVAAFILTAILAPIVAPYDYVQQDVLNRRAAPSWAHPLGTDHLGRDLLSRVIHGSRVALGVALPSIGIALTCGVTLGLVAGYFGGRVDDAIVLLLDSVQTFPGLILILAVIALLGPSLSNLILIIGLTWSPGYARVTRAQVLSVKQNLYIEAERSLGAGNLRIVAGHVLPNVLAPILILGAMDLPSVIVAEAGLSLLGLGLRPPNPSWGVILAEGFAQIRLTPWPILWSGLALAIITLGFTLFGEALRDVLDPRLSQMRRA